MAITTSKMGLRVWNTLQDRYDHDQLADNWAKVDQHDHTSNRGVQIPTDGIADTAITAAKLATSVDPTRAYQSYKTIRSGSAPLTDGTTVGTYALSPSHTKVTLASAANATATGNAAVFHFNPADYTSPTGRLTYLRLGAVVTAAGLLPNSTFTIGLYPVTAVTTTYTVGAVIAGSTTSVTPTANQISNLAGTDFLASLVPAGFYALGVAVSGATVAASAHVIVNASLSVRQV